MGRRGLCGHRRDGHHRLRVVDHPLAAEHLGRWRHPLCGPDPAYGCTSGGYAGQSTGWPGQRYGAGYASSNQYGYHNCTLYAAYRLAANGVTDPGWAANANGWATAAAAAGVRVDQSPAVGSIAQWNGGPAGHVAYVETVTASYIELTDDNVGLPGHP